MSKYPNEELIERIGQALIDNDAIVPMSQFFGTKLARDDHMAVSFVSNLLCQIAGKPLEDSWQFQPMAEGIVSQIRRDHPLQ